MATLGMYYPSKSFWHLLDPRTKTLMIFVILGTLVVSSGLEVSAFLLVSIFFYVTAGIPFKLGIEVILKFKWLLIISFVANLLFPLGKNYFTYLMTVNFLRAIDLLFRLCTIFLLGAWLSFVTKPQLLIEGLSSLLKPVRKLILPQFDLDLMMGLTLRFIPDLLEEAENIMIAQRIRGVSPKFTWRNLTIRIKSMVIPIFILSIRKSAFMAMAMKARGYRPGVQRASFEEISLKACDYCLISLSVIFLIYFLIVKVW
jgi:energy-coupling factor transport system permease protein